jgi:hypothetical protein
LTVEVEGDESGEGNEEEEEEEGDVAGEVLRDADGERPTEGKLRELYLDDTTGRDGSTTILEGGRGGPTTMINSPERFKIRVAISVCLCARSRRNSPISIRPEKSISYSERRSLHCSKS